MLGHNAIKLALERGYITVTGGPEPLFIGPNSIDMHLGPNLFTYDKPPGRHVDPRQPLPLKSVPLMDDGSWWLSPSLFYIGETQERMACKGLVPFIDGRSTAGRLGISVHQTAGKGDNGFDGKWTLEITCRFPVKIRPGDRLVQVLFAPCLSAKGLQDMMPALNYLSGKHEVGSGSLELQALYSNEGHHYQDQDGAQPYAPLMDD